MKTYKQFAVFVEGKLVSRHWTHTKAFAKADKLIKKGITKICVKQKPKRGGNNSYCLIWRYPKWLDQ